MGHVLLIASLSAAFLESWKDGDLGILVHSAYPYYSRTRHRGARAECDWVQDLTEAVKAGDPRATRVAAQCLATHPRLAGFRGTVIPAPRSSSSRPGLIGLAEELVSAGVGQRAANLVRREVPVGSSRMRRRQGLGGVSVEQHAESMGVSGEIPDGPILIVDDVFTTGGTIQAVALKLRQAGHTGPICGATVSWVSSDPSQMSDCPQKYATRRI